MASVTVSVPDELKRKMDENRIMNWSAVARKAFEEQIAKLETLEAIVSKSKATEKDVEVLSKKIKHGIWLRHKETKNQK